MLLFLYQTVWDGHDERGTLSKFALHLNGALHQFHQMLHDGHAQSRADDTALCTGAFTGELLEEVGQEVGGHADARI